MRVLARSVAAALSLALLGPASAWSALAPRAEGPPFTIAAPGPTNNLDMATNAAGRTVFVWPGVAMRVYDAAGQAVTPELQVDEGGGGTYPRVALDAAGNIAVVWHRGGASGPAGDSAWMRLFDAQGVALGPERLIDPGWPSGSSYPTVARDAVGQMLVAWTRFDGASAYTGWVRAFGADGQPLAPEQAIVGDLSRFPSDVSIDASGEYVVLFGYRWGARFDALGHQLGAAFSTNIMGLTGYYDMASVARRPDGRFVVGWFDTPDNDMGDAWIRLFEASGTQRGSDVYMGNEFDAVFRFLGRVACSTRGDLVMVWPSLTIPRFRSVDRDGLDMGPTISLPDLSDHFAAGMDARGNYTIGWKTRDAAREVRAQRFCADMRVRGPEARRSCIGGSAFFTVEATGRMPIAYRWRRNGVDLVESVRVTGTNSPTLVIDPVESGDAGNYDCVITDACAAGGALTSVAVALMVAGGARIEEATDLALTRVGTSVVLNWTDVPNATDYVVYEDVWPDSGFLAVVGTATSGATGLTLPAPRSDRFFRVTGRSTACGAARSR